MSGKYLLDNNIVIALWGGDNDVVRQFNQNMLVYVPSIVFGELYYGAKKSARSDLNLARIDEFASSVEMIDVDFRDARLYGEIKDQLRKNGRPIPENDIWIAALAMRHELTLVTRDAHFQSVQGLKIEMW